MDLHNCEEVKAEECQKVSNSYQLPVQVQNIHGDPYGECKVKKLHQTHMIRNPVFTKEYKMYVENKPTLGRVE